MKTGDLAPDFELPDETGTTRSLKEFLAGGPVVLYFYPAAMTPGCTAESCHFRDLAAEFAEVGAQRVGISPDPVDKQKQFSDKHSFDFPLLSDPDRQVLEAYGAYGEKKLYGKTVQGVIRSTFVVDEEGRIALAQYNVKATGHVAKLRRDLGLSA